MSLIIPPSSDGGVTVDVTIAAQDAPIDVNATITSYPNLVLGFGDLVVDAWGTQKMSLPKSLFHGMFTFDIPQSQFFIYENSTQVYTSTNVTSVNGAGQLLTTVAKHTLKLESRVCPRYQPNRGHLFSTALWAPTKTNDGVREWGVGTEDNLVIFRLKSDGKLYAVLKSGGVQTYEQEIDTSSIPGFSVEKGNLYDIQYQWRGVGNYKWFINLTLVHTAALVGTLTALSVENPALPCRFYAKRTTQDVELNIGCVDITSENGAEEQLQYGAAYATNVSVISDTPVIVVKQPLLISTETNTRDLTLTRISFNCSKKAVFKVWMTRDPSAITGATYKYVNYGSFVECDSPDMNSTAVRATAVTTASLRLVTAVPVEATTPREVSNPWPTGITFSIVRGDYLIVTCTAATANADVVVEWGEHI